MPGASRCMAPTVAAWVERSRGSALRARFADADTVNSVTGRYDDSEAALFSQVDVDEIDTLLKVGVRQFLKDGSKIVHLLTRVRMTLVAAHTTISSMRRQMNEQSAHLARIGTPTTLNPLDALKYLDDEEKERIFDRIARERLKLLRDLVVRAQGDAAAVGGELAAVREVAVSLSQMADLPPHVRAEATKLLASLPDAPSTVHYPAMLDYPDPAPTFAPREAERPLPPEPTFRAEPATPAAPPAPPAGSRPATFVDPYGSANSRTARPTYVDPYAKATRLTNGEAL